MKFVLRNGMEILFVNLKNKENWSKQDFKSIMDGMSEKEENKALETMGVI